MRPIYLQRIDHRIDTVHPAVMRVRWNPRKCVPLTWAAIAGTGAWLGLMFFMSY